MSITATKQLSISSKVIQSNTNMMRIAMTPLHLKLFENTLLCDTFCPQKQKHCWVQEMAFCQFRHARKELAPQLQADMSEQRAAALKGIF